MIALIGIALAFIWLLRETDYLRIRLPMGADIPPVPPKPAQYRAYNSLRKKKHYEIEIHHGSNQEVPDGPTYHIVLDPGVTEPLCGWDWLDKHVGDLVDYQPRVQMQLAGVRYDMTIKAPGILDQVMKANKLSKQERARYQE